MTAPDSPRRSRSRPPTDEALSPVVPSSGRSRWVGPYRLLELLGRGGMAEVYRAERPVELAAGGSRICVVKTIRGELASEPEFARMFADEIQVMRLLQHPNIVRTYDHGIADGSLFLAMELLDGLSLARVVRGISREQQTLPLAMVAYIGAEIALALAYAHAATDDTGGSLGLVHRDVSPSNVMVLFDGQVKLVDFGIAKITSTARQLRRQLTNVDVVKGKLNYMAPEQVLGQPIDARTDLFALGVMLWEMLVWRPLFARPTSQEVAAMVVGGDIPRPSSLRADVPPGLEAVVMRALERDPRRRQASAGELARELAAFGLPRGQAARALGQLVRAVERRRATPPQNVSLTPSATASALATPHVGTTPGATPVTARRPRLAAVRTPSASARVPAPTPAPTFTPTPAFSRAPAVSPAPVTRTLEIDRVGRSRLRRAAWTVLVAAAGFLAGTQWAKYDAAPARSAPSESSPSLQREARPRAVIQPLAVPSGSSGTTKRR